MVTTSTSAPVSSSKPAMTLSGMVLEFCAAQTVRVVPVRSASWAGQSTGPPESVPVPGSEHPVRASAPAVASASAVRNVFFIEWLLFLLRGVGGEAQGAGGGVGAVRVHGEGAGVGVPGGLPFGEAGGEHGGDGDVAAGEVREAQFGAGGAAAAPDRHERFAFASEGERGPRVGPAGEPGGPVRVPAGDGRAQGLGGR